MGSSADSLARPLAYALAPLLLVQAGQVRRRAPVLPEAAGPREGTAGPGGAASGPRLMQLLAFGEDQAAGAGVAGQAEALGCQCAAALARRTGRPVGWQVTARGGVTASQALAELVPQIGRRRFDVIVAALGVNDAVRLTPSRRWGEEIKDLVRALESHLRPAGRIVVCGVPALSDSALLPQPLRAVLGGHARTLDRALAQIADGCASCQYQDTPSDREDPTPSGGTLHRSAQGYQRWAEHLLPAMLPGSPAAE